MHVIPRLVLALSFACLLAGLPMDAIARPGRWNLERYEASAFRDSLMSRYDTPVVVVLDREFVEMKPKGESIEARIEHEWIVFVREPEAAGAYGRVERIETPGRALDQLEVYVVRGNEQTKIDVDKSDVTSCSLYRKHRRHLAAPEKLEPGDVIAARTVTVIEGVNPAHSHRFDRDVPVLQSDITLDISRELFESRASAGWGWWAGSWPGSIGQHTWEKPKSWRFRWGEKDIAPSNSPRSVYTAWTFDPIAATRGPMIAAESQARGSDDAAYRGPTLSAHELSGLEQRQRTHGIREDDAGRPTEASFQLTSWEETAALYADLVIADRVDEKHLPILVSRILSQAPRRADPIEVLARAVTEDVKTIDVPLSIGLNDVHRPMETHKAGCGSALDKAVLLVGMLRTREVEAMPVLLSRDRIPLSCRSVEVFEAVGVIIRTAAGRRYYDVETGRTTSSLPPSWAVALTLPVGGEPRIVLGDELASLLE